MFYSATEKGFYTAEIHGENIPSDAVEITDREYQDIMTGQTEGKIITPNASTGKPELADVIPAGYKKSGDSLILDVTGQFQTVKKIMIDAIQKILDAKAQEWGYDNIISVCTYANSTIEEFKTEGTAFLLWRDQCWATGATLLAQYEAGKMEPVTTVEEFIALMPALKL
jgi:hypothetical protein